MDTLKTDRDQRITEKMKEAGLSDSFIADFLKKVDLVASGETGIAKWEEVGDLDPKKDEISLEDIHKSFGSETDNLAKLVVIKLNGGLGTSMGLSGPKSLIELRDGMSFLEIIARQMNFLRDSYGKEVPLLFMDSFNTQKESQEELKKIGFSQKMPSTFLQHKVPRLKQSDLMPLDTGSEKEDWCPPGHGDIWISLLETGILDSLLESGHEVAFVSNGDNLGATVDPSILNYFLAEGLEFCMEMTPKTKADKKGGAIFRRLLNGKPRNLELLETAQVPSEHMSEFAGLGKFRTFSTNNLWIHLPSLKNALEKGDFSLSLIVNPKKIADEEVFQLESAMGSAIQNFSRTKGIIIPRSRFAPVKKCEDYLVRRSDAYQLNPDYSVTMSDDRVEAGLEEVYVSLDEEHYKKIQDFNRLFTSIPSLAKAESLEVEGVVHFDMPVEIVGKVKITNKSGAPQKISSLEKTKLLNEEIVF